jgi:O-antigen ligase
MLLLNEFNIIKFLIILFPFSIIVGNAATNFTIFFIIITFIFSSVKKKSSSVFKENIYLFIFPAALIVSTLLSEYINQVFFKSLSMMRYPLFAISLIYFFNLYNNLFKILTLSIIISILFLCSSMLVEFFFLISVNDELFIFKRFSGLFFSELIAGWFLVKFSPFLVAFYYLKNYNRLFLFISICILFLFILLAKERSATLYAIISIIFFFIIFYKNIYIKFIYLFLFVIFVFSIIYFQPGFKNRYFDSIIDSNNSSQGIFQKTNDKYYLDFNNSYWGAHFLTSINIYKNNKFFGSGFKTFRIECKKNIYENIASNARKHRCSTHPHNYFLEILSDTGLFGVLSFIITMAFFFIKYLSLLKNAANKSFFIVVLFVINYIPNPTSGSIFTTNYASVFWFSIGILIYLAGSKKKLY